MSEERSEEIGVHPYEHATQDNPMAMKCTASTHTTEIRQQSPRTSSKSTQTTFMSNSVKTQTVIDATSTFLQRKHQTKSVPTLTAVLTSLSRATCSS